MGVKAPEGKVTVAIFPDGLVLVVWTTLMVVGEFVLMVYVKFIGLMKRGALTVQRVPIGEHVPS